MKPGPQWIRSAERVLDGGLLSFALGAFIADVDVGESLPEQAYCYGLIFGGLLGASIALWWVRARIEKEARNQEPESGGIP